MNTLFKDLTAGSVVYALIKEDEPTYCEGSIVSVSQPRVNMPAFNPGQMQLPQVQNVVDVTYTLDGKNYTDTVDVTASIFSTRNPGPMTLVSTDKEAIVRELHATLKSSETYVKDAKRDVPKHEKRIKKCKSLIAQLDTEFKERQQTEERFSKLEESQQALDKKLDLILSRLPQK
jgi:hypothetical protein